MGALSDQQRASVGTLASGAKLDRYEILTKLAAGGMATVYVARAHGAAGFERLVAIKVLHSNLAHEDEFIHMFWDEARLAARLRHPNVVPTIDVSVSKEAGCGYFLVMDYIEGDHLGALLSNAHKSGEKLPVSITLRILADALAGLGAAHDLCDDRGKLLQLVHRDVSPHNILVGRDGVVRLTDFGVAKAADRLTHTRDGQVKGKLAYMAPEQASGAATDARSDLFSMGVILWECLTGRRLFRADTTAATLHRLLHEQIEKPSQSDPALAPLDALVMRALARTPSERFRNAEEFARAIEEVAPQVGGMASLRGVARSVKQHAAAKLKREKKLVDDALRALRPAEESDTGEPLLEESTNVSETDVSLTGQSLSASKISGVFSHDTMPGSRRAAPRSSDTTTGATNPQRPPTGDVEATKPDQLAAPAHAGQRTSSPELRAASPWHRRVPRASLAAAGLLVAIGAYYLTGATRSPAPTITPAPAGSATQAVRQAPSTPQPPQPIDSWDNKRGTGMPATRPTTVAVSVPAAPPEAAERRVEAQSVRAAERGERVSRGSGRKDENVRSWQRRARKEGSARQVERPSNEPPPRPLIDETDVMPNPYHD